MQNLKKAALSMCVLACMSFCFNNNASAAEVMPSSGVAYEDLDREISHLEMVYAHDKHSWASVTDLSLLYYDRGEYKNCYKMSKKALQLYEDGYAYENDDDILRESLVKGAAAAYNLGEYRDSEKLLKKMISLNLRGSDDNAKTYMGWAYYYLSNIERIRGNYDRSHYYGGICINYCPRYRIFVDYWDCFYYTGTFWHWRHHHHRDYRPPMPPPRPHWRDHRHHHDVHRPAPHHSNSVNRARTVEPLREHVPAHQPRPVVKHPIPQKHSVHQASRTVNRAPQQHVERPQEHRPAVHQTRPVQEHRAVQRPTQQRPTYQQRPNVQQNRPAVQQTRPAVQQSRPAVQQTRPVQGQRTVQRSAQQRPTYQKRPVEQKSRTVQEQYPIYQQRQGMHGYGGQRPVQRQNSYPRGNQHRR